MIVAVLIIAACQPKPQPVVVDLAASKAEVNALMDTYLKAFNAKDIKTLTTLITDDGLYCGTDPSELMDKKHTTDAWTMAFADTAMNYAVALDKREIRVTPDGNSAIVMEQQFFNPTPKIQLRIVSRAVKTADGWEFDFISWNFIHKNEDIGRLIKALE